MKISEYLKHYIDELINEHDDCDLNDLTVAHNGTNLSNIVKDCRKIK